MTEPHTAPADPMHAPLTGADAAHVHEGHISDQTFMKVFFVLLVCTALSFALNQLIGHHSVVTNFVLILAVAVVKATLVVTFFMHLKIDWRKVFVFIMPTMILAPIVLIVLWPDIVLAWTRVYPMP
ncbi:MAG: cytochrome C oxidase subunit IV family protein [Gemmataceae bacterium]